jgi:Sad1 / UNC-like C-terminal
MPHRVLIFSFPLVLAGVALLQYEPALAQVLTPLPPISQEVNLLAPNQGGQAIIVPHEGWLKPLTEKDQGPWGGGSVGEEAVYAFKDEKPATFSSLSLLIYGADDRNIRQFELFAADDSPTGEFRSLGKFTTVNARMVKTFYQVFPFPQTTARYFKIRILSNYGGTWGDKSKTILPPFRLMGKAPM